MLSYNHSFNIHALFSEIDADKGGFLTVEELSKWAASYGPLENAGINWHAIARLWNAGADGEVETQRIYFDEFALGLTGTLASAIPRTRILDAYGFPVDVRFSASDSEALKREYVASSLVAVLAETDKLAAMDERPLSAGQADRLWRALDRYGYGPLPVTTVGQWLWDVARFRAPLAELESLLNGGAVTQDQFKARLAAPDSAEKEEDAKAGDR